jgi:beta-glucosidase
MVYNLARAGVRYWFTRCPTKLLEEIFKVNRNIVLVLNNGRPLIPWAADNIPAIVEAWQLGTQSGNAAIAQVLYGDYNPSGKL